MSEHSRAPYHEMGKDFVYLTSRLHELRSLSRGRQGVTYVGTFETTTGTNETLVIKKFHGGASNQVEDCRFLSQTAVKFREAGLPVLPLVKSITTAKDISDYDWDGLQLGLAPVFPPFAIMSFLKQSGEIKKILEFGSDTHTGAWETLRANPAELDNLVSDIAKINQLGYTRGVVTMSDGYGGSAGIGPHPIEYSWIFTESKDGILQRWLVDLNNFTPQNKLNVHQQKVSSPKHDIEDLLNFFWYKFSGVKKDDSYYRNLYLSIMTGSAEVST